MSLQNRIQTEMKNAMRNKDTLRLSAIRLINAAIKDKEIAARTGDDAPAIGDDDVLAILGKMVKQRQESARAYEEGGRIELAEQEREEIAVIEDFLPAQLDDDETAAAVDAAIADVGAESIRDMGKVMGALKSKYTGQMDFGKVGPLVKGKLG